MTERRTKEVPREWPEGALDHSLLNSMARIHLTVYRDGAAISSRERGHEKWYPSSALTDRIANLAEENERLRNAIKGALARCTAADEAYDTATRHPYKDGTRQQAIADFAWSIQEALEGKEDQS